MKCSLTKLASSFGRPGDLRRILKGALTVFSIRTLGALLSYTLVVLLARWMGAFEFGVYVNASAWVVILSLVAPLGFLQAVVRFIPEYSAKMKWRRVAGVIDTSRAIALLSGLVIACVGMLFIAALDSRFAADESVALYIALACVPVIALVRLHSELFRAFGRVGLAYTPYFIISPTIVISVAGLFVASGEPIGAATAMAIVFFTALAILTLQVGVLMKVLPDEVRKASRTCHAGSWFRVALPLTLIQGFGLVMTQIDLVVLAMFREPEGVAVYGAAAQTAGLINYVLFAILALAAPMFSKLHAERDHPALQRLAAETVQWAFWLSLTLALGLLLVGGSVLALFGPIFAEGYPVLATLLTVPMILAVAGPHEQLLCMTGNQAMAASIFGCTAITNIGLNLLLIPHFGLMGAAVATVLSGVVHAAALILTARYRLGFAALLPFPRRPKHNG